VLFARVAELNPGSQDMAEREARKRVKKGAVQSEPRVEPSEANLFRDGCFKRIDKWRMKVSLRVRD
jgi:hypothetical protein